MTAERSAAGPIGETALCERLLAEAAAVCRARRALLLLDDEAGLRVVASRLPRREQPAALRAAIEPWLAEAARTGKAKLRHGPEGVEQGRQRSCIVVPIGTGRSRFGFLYADVDGRHGRFAPADLDRLVGLARRAAAHLAGARRHSALTHKLEAQG